MKKTKLELIKNGKVFFREHFDSFDEASTWLETQKFMDNEGNMIVDYTASLLNIQDSIEYKFFEYKEKMKKDEEKSKEILNFLKFYLKELLIKDIVNKSQVSQFRKSIAKPFEEALVDGDLDEARQLLVGMHSAVFFTDTMKEELLQRFEQ